MSKMLYHLKDWFVHKVLLRLIPFDVLRRLFILKNQDVGANIQLAYSQDGEDLFLDRLFENQGSGFFVDIGAFHPQRFSNTYALYQRGWRGINIDPYPGSMNIFKSMRPDDTNLEIALSSTTGTRPYYIFNRQEVSTFDASRVEVNKTMGYTLLETRQVPVMTLAQVMSEHSKAQRVDVLSLDVEGHELEILRGIDWNMPHPRVIAVELFRSDHDDTSHALFRAHGRQNWYATDDIASSPIYQFLFDHHYRLFAKSIITSFFIAEDFDYSS